MSRSTTLRERLIERLQTYSLALSWSVFIVTFATGLGSVTPLGAISMIAPAPVTMAFERHLIVARRRERRKEEEGWDQEGEFSEKPNPQSPDDQQPFLEINHNSPPRDPMAPRAPNWMKASLTLPRLYWRSTITLRLVLTGLWVLGVVAGVGGLVYDIQRDDGRAARGWVVITLLSSTQVGVMSILSSLCVQEREQMMLWG